MRSLYPNGLRSHQISIISFEMCWKKEIPGKDVQPIHATLLYDSYHANEDQNESWKGASIKVAG